MTRQPRGGSLGQALEELVEDLAVFQNLGRAGRQLTEAFMIGWSADGGMVRALLAGGFVLSGAAKESGLCGGPGGVIVRG